MTIKGIEAAINAAKERVIRSKESICIVQIGNDEYVLWRESTIDALVLVYKQYKVITTVRMNK